MPTVVRLLPCILHLDDKEGGYKSCTDVKGMILIRVSSAHRSSKVYTAYTDEGFALEYLNHLQEFSVKR